MTTLYWFGYGQYLDLVTSNFNQKDELDRFG